MGRHSSRLLKYALAMEPLINSMDLAVAVMGAIVVGQAAMSAVLLTPPSHSPVQQIWLLVFLFAVALVSAGDVVEHLGLHPWLWWLLPPCVAALLCIGPALWLYARSATAAAPPPPAWRDAWHFVPAVLLSASLLIGDATVAEAKPDATAHRSMPELLALAPIALQILAYLAAVLHTLHRTRATLKLAYSTLDGRTLNWLLATALLCVAIVLCWVLSWGMSIGVSDLLTNALAALVLLVTGHFGLHQRNVFVPVPRSEPLPPPPPPPPPPLQPPEPKTAKYTRAALPADIAQHLKAALEQAMHSDKPFLENDLTLADLAKRIGATPHQMSQLLSQHLGETFFDFVNRHRVEAVKATLARPQNAARPLLEIALECGFGSKSTFNDTFRKATGMSPSEYRKRHGG